MTRERALKALDAIRNHGRVALGQDARGPYQAGAEDLLRELDAAGAFTEEPAVTKSQAKKWWNEGYNSAGPGQSAGGPTFSDFDEAWRTLGVG
jgi:hypothetical protein